MFSGFSVAIDKYSSLFDGEFFKLYEIGKNHIHSESASHRIKNHLKSSVLDGNQIRAENFPIIGTNVFLSHSHEDEELANAFAGWLNREFKLNVFIDSNLWNYADELLKELDNKYCLKQNGSYDYKTRNKSTTHVHMMLMTALQEMIDQVECVMILKTKNFAHEQKFENIIKYRTYSPWIYSEVLATRLIRRKPLLLYRDYSDNTPLLHEDTTQYLLNALQISYEINLNHLERLQCKDLLEWHSTYMHFKDEYPLDYLYKQNGISSRYKKEMKNTKLLFHDPNIFNIKRMLNESNTEVLLSNTNKRYGNCDICKYGHENPNKIVYQCSHCPYKLYE